MWNGIPGEVVRIKACDAVLVKRVSVRFTDATGKALEEGEAEEAGGQWWRYTTQGDLSGAVTVTAIAVDLLGNVTELS